MLHSIGNSADAQRYLAEYQRTSAVAAADPELADKAAQLQQLLGATNSQQLSRKGQTHGFLAMNRWLLMKCRWFSDSALLLLLLGPQVRLQQHRHILSQSCHDLAHKVITRKPRQRHCSGLFNNTRSRLSHCAWLIHTAVFIAALKANGLPCYAFIVTALQYYCTEKFPHSLDLDHRVLVHWRSLILGTQL
jgi:hypothetical protein